MANLLIADDDPDYLEVFCDGLEHFGHTVVGVESGADVVPELKSKDFDLVFLDVMMKGGGAITVLHQIREVDPSIPVVVVTGRADLLNSPLFKEGMREASAKVPKTSSLSEINALVSKLLVE